MSGRMTLLWVGCWLISDLGGWGLYETWTRRQRGAHDLHNGQDVVITSSLTKGSNMCSLSTPILRIYMCSIDISPQTRPSAPLLQKVVWLCFFSSDPEKHDCGHHTSLASPYSPIMDTTNSHPCIRPLDRYAVLTQTLRRYDATCFPASLPPVLVVLLSSKR
jgi:hypothetical protein